MMRTLPALLLLASVATATAAPQDANRDAMCHTLRASPAYPAEARLAVVCVADDGASTYTLCNTATGAPVLLMAVQIYRHTCATAWN